jgi:uncharacterized protein with PIN domain
MATPQTEQGRSFASPQLLKKMFDEYRSEIASKLQDFEAGERHEAIKKIQREHRTELEKSLERQLETLERYVSRKGHARSNASKEASRQFVWQYSDFNGADLTFLEQSTLSAVHRNQLVSDTSGLDVDAILKRLDSHEGPLHKSIRIRFEILEEFKKVITEDTSPSLTDSRNQAAQLYDEVEQQHYRLIGDTAIYKVVTQLDGRRFNDVRENLLDLLGDETEDLLELRQHQVDLLQHLQTRIRENKFVVKFYQKYGKSDSNALREHEEMGRELVDVNDGLLRLLDGIIEDLKRDDLTPLRERFGNQLDKLRKVLKEDKDIAKLFPSDDE